MKVLGLGNQRGGVVVDQHDMKLIDDAKRVRVLDEKVGEFLDVLATDVSDLRRGLRAMTQQRLDGNFRSGSILKQLLRKIILRFLNVILLAGSRSVIIVRELLVAVHVHVITIDDEERWILLEEFSQAYKQKNTQKSISFEQTRFCRLAQRLKICK